MQKFDGELIPVSHILGRAFIPIFIQRFCVPEFGDQTGFQTAAPTVINGGAVLNPSAVLTPPADELSRDRVARLSTGYYYPKYLLDPRVSAHPQAYTQNIFHEGPYLLSNMWGSSRFHYSCL